MKYLLILGNCKTIQEINPEYLSVTASSNGEDVGEAFSLTGNEWIASVDDFNVRCNTHACYC